MCRRSRPACAPVGAAGGLLQPLATKTLVDRLATGETIAGILIALTALVVLGTAVEAFGAYVSTTGRECRFTHPHRASAGFAAADSRAHSRSAQPVQPLVAFATRGLKVPVPVAA